MSLIAWDSMDKDGDCSLSSNDMSLFINGIGGVRSNKEIPNKKVYWEIKFDDIVNINTGVSNSEITPTWAAGGRYGNSARIIASSGVLYPGGVGYTTPFVEGDVLGIALDVLSGIMVCYKNGVNLGVAFNDIGLLSKPLKAFSVRNSSATKGGLTANFGASSFDIVKQNPGAYKELLDEGYLPYDTDNAHRDNTLSKARHLIKTNNKIHTLSEDMSVLTYPELTEPLTFEEYDEWGMDDLNGYEKPIEWVKRPMDEGEKVGEGRIVRKTVDKNEFIINSLTIK